MYSQAMPKWRAWGRRTSGRGLYGFEHEHLETALAAVRAAFAESASMVFPHCERREAKTTSMAHLTVDLLPMSDHRDGVARQGKGRARDSRSRSAMPAFIL